MEIRVSLEGARELEAALKRVEKGAIREAVSALNVTALHVQNELKEETTNARAINTGALRKSWHIQKATQASMEARVGTNLVPHYGPDVEYGTRPHRPPISALKQWAKRKLHNEAAAYPIAKKIARRGTSGRHIFAKGTNDAAHVLEQELARAARAIEGEWG